MGLLTGRRFPALLILVSCLLLSAYPSSVPPPWFDEGWIFSVARNWLEQGFYGESLNGQPKPADMLNAGFPLVAVAACSFRIFGTGIWQGRLPFLFFALGSILAVYGLARKLYGAWIAKATLFVLVCMPGISPILTGKQALGDLPAIFFLLCGLLCFISFWQRPLCLTALVSLSWALAFIIKQQAMAFTLSGLVFSSFVLFITHQRRAAQRLMALMAATLAIFGLFLFIQERLVGGNFLGEPGLYKGTAIVLAGKVRSVALYRSILLGLPVILGLLSRVHLFRTVNSTKDTPSEGVSAARLALWSITASWFAWYACFSIAWDRYLFPPLFLGSVFFGALLKDVFVAERNEAHIPPMRLEWRKASRFVTSLVLVVIMVLAISRNAFLLIRAFAFERDTSVVETANYINSFTPNDALIESYDKELTFLLNRRYHYPPDQIQLRLNRRTFAGEDLSIDYNPLQADPDYVVLGPHSRLWGLYDDVLKRGQFRLVKSVGRYEIYRKAG